MPVSRVVSEQEARARLARFERHQASPGNGKASAVAIVLFAPGGKSAVYTVITRRASNLNAHPGQWALPGGRLDPGESAQQAALREVWEELGLRLEADSVLGALDDFVSATGFHITPVVLWAERDPSCLVANPAEVASMHVVPIEELDVDALFIDDPDLPTAVLKFPFQGRHIHAPTGAFLFQFREVVLHDRPTRVHGYSSPLRLNRTND